jgi:hypothetical protein
VSILVGDRLCIQCGYNLVGQPVLREPHYQMLIARCPECGTVASLQEYPLLGRWATRWAALVAAVWVLVAIVVYVGGGAAMFGATMWSVEFGTFKYMAVIDNQYRTWFSMLPAATQPAGITTTTPPYYTSNNLNLWWTPETAATTLDAAGGRWRAIDWVMLFYGTPWLILPLSLGLFWAVALPGRTRAGLLLWGMAVIAVSFTFCGIAMINIINLDKTATYLRSWDAAQSQLGGPIIVFTQGLQAAILAMGLVFGRPLARRFLRIMLVPRLRSSLAFLWLCDGLTPPTSKP